MSCHKPATVTMEDLRHPPLSHQSKNILCPAEPVGTDGMGAEHNGRRTHSGCRVKDLSSLMSAAMGFINCL
jgi:hypothetical protein